MTSRYEEFDRSQLKITPLSQRQHDLTCDAVLPLLPIKDVNAPYHEVAKNICEAREKKKAVVLMMGAHVLRDGVQRYLIDLMEKGLLSCIAINGAGVIHDFEFALAGATTENVANYIKDGRFGLWQETGIINEVVAGAAQDGKGLGEAVGEYIEQENLPHRKISILAAGYRLGIPITVHVGMGYDIVHEHPSCNGAAYGETSYRDFLIFAKVLEQLDHGVVMNFGSAVMGPEIFLKALAMVRNVGAQQGRAIENFSTLVCDLAELTDEYEKEPCRSDSRYYFRPWKTLLVRTLSGAGQSYYIRARHKESVAKLWSAIMAIEK